MKTTTKINLLVAFIFVVIFGVVAVIYMGSLGNAAAEAGRTPIVREDSHHLTVAENEKVTVVEFLDFECESCAAVYPTVEELRERYGDQVTFVVRYFPIPSHKNAEKALSAGAALLVYPGGDWEAHRPTWEGGKVDFAGLKLKLVASIVAISGINLLKHFMALSPDHMSTAKEHQLFWMVVIHLVFIASGVMLAFMDKIVATTGSRH